MTPLEQHFNFVKQPHPATSDILEHLDTLKELASECKHHVTEFGFRYGTSFTALLMGKPKVAVSYDISVPEWADKLIETIKGNTDAKVINGNTLEITIKPTELLFIDTLHTYEQLAKELNLHAHLVDKYLVFHDTETFGIKSEDGTTPGLMQAIDELLLKDQWKLEKHYPNNNGLTVLKRRN